MKNLLLFCTLLCFSKIHCQTMYVRPITGTQSVYLTDNVRKLTFSNGNLLLTPNSGFVASHPLSDNRYINFTDLTLGISNMEPIKNGFYVYPNPSSQLLHVANVNPNISIGLIQLISLDGKLLLEVKPMESSNTQLDISALPQGMYLCKISSDNQQQILKFLKQ
jgi:hypothetical protein